MQWHEKSQSIELEAPFSLIENYMDEVAMMSMRNCKYFFVIFSIQYL